ncbi:MAG TPA: S-methyl-5-thioribose-1-phosphate isomerase [Firmicutes bacterium]|nr:S-methyl-5-thioribose-1-phosphate isomerase [Candidatus Fermentithermobacillaceae bacterium]
MIPAIKWDQGVLSLLDQRLLPHETKYVTCTDHRQMAKAIKDMVVRGAPAIGISGGYGLALAAIESTMEFGCGNGNRDALAAAEQFLREAASSLIAARPTAVNLAWAVERVLNTALSSLGKDGIRCAAEAALSEARSIELEDIEVNHKIGINGAALIKPGSSIMTHCNAGALATGGWGTALGVIRQAWSENKVAMVYANETRPFLQGARLTAWELVQDGIDVTLLVDSAAGYLMSLGKIDAVIVGADRIAANGDVANKIGTYTLACLCRQHDIPFYVAAPVSTFDLSLACGREIHVEERSESEVLEFMGKAVAPAGAKALNPSFDITPGTLVSAIITENGTVFPPIEENLAGVVKRG